MTQSEGEQLRAQLQDERDALIAAESKQLDAAKQHYKEQLAAINADYEHKLEEAGLATFIRLKRRS